MEGVTRIPRFEAKASGEAIPALRQTGVAIIDDLATADAIDRLRDAIMARHPEFVSKHLLRDFQDNGAGRFVAPVAITRAVHDSGALTSAALRTVADRALGPDWVFEAVGLLMAFPGCTRQRPHRDGTALFPETPLGAILPAYALTVVIPLVDVDASNGATAFQPGTHRLADAAPEGDSITADLPRGSCILWNYLTVHWGEPNHSQHSRPALYATICRPFWTDTANFGDTMHTRLLVDDGVLPLLDRRFARAPGYRRPADQAAGAAKVGTGGEQGDQTASSA